MFHWKVIGHPHCFPIHAPGLCRLFASMPLIWSPFEPLFQRWMGGSTKCCLRREILVAASSSHPLVKRLPKILDASGRATIALSDLKNMMFMLPPPARG